MSQQIKVTVVKYIVIFVDSTQLKLSCQKKNYIPRIQIDKIFYACNHNKEGYKE